MRPEDFYAELPILRAEEILMNTAHTNTAHTLPEERDVKVGDVIHLHDIDDRVDVKGSDVLLDSRVLYSSPTEQHAWRTAGALARLVRRYPILSVESLQRHFEELTIGLWNRKSTTVA